MANEGGGFIYPLRMSQFLAHSGLAHARVNYDVMEHQVLRN